jgi:hypothetical protein
MLKIQIEGFDGRGGSLEIHDGDRIFVTAERPTRVEHALDACKSLAKALGSRYDFSFIVKPR